MGTEPITQNEAPPSNHQENGYLRLFVAGNTLRSQNAITILRGLIERYQKGRCQFEVVDIYQQPELARQAQIIATPTLVKYLPKPQKVMIGDLSQTDRVLTCMGWG